MSDYLSLEEIAKAEDLPLHDLEVPEWGGKVQVRGLSYREMREVRKQARDDQDNFQTELFEDALLINGMRIPTVDQAQLEILREKNADIIQRLVNSIMSNSGEATEDTESDKTPVEEQEARFHEGAGRVHAVLDSGESGEDS